MQRDPSYDSPLVEVLDYLEGRIAACAAAGIPREHIAVDPGIGFGKLVPHNLELLAGIGAFHALGCAVVLGVSRKSTIARLSRGEPPERRLPGSLAAALSAVRQGVQILRVHDVAETRQALAVWQRHRGRLDFSFPGPAPFEDRADPVGFGKHIELFDPDADHFDPRIDEASGTDALGKSLAKLDMPGARDLADRRDDLLVIDHAPAVLARDGVARHEFDRDADPLLALALARAYADAARQNETAYGDRVSGIFG